MLDLHHIQDDLDAFRAYQVEEHRRQRRRAARAVRVLRACHDAWASLRDAVASADVDELVAGPREPTAAAAPASPRPTPVTVAATDGSQIYPDRHVEPTCFLLNVSQVAFQYGTHEAPVLRATPRFHPSQGELLHPDDHYDARRAAMSTEVVSALRDEWELGALLEAARAARRDDRPLVALVDGTLIRWMVRGMRDRTLETRLIERYTALLDEFHYQNLPLASYISMPGNTEVVNLLRFFVGEVDGGLAPPADADLDGEPLAGLLDRHVFARVLPLGARSARFSAASRIVEESYPEGSRICYVYVHVPTRAPGGMPASQGDASQGDGAAPDAMGAGEAGQAGEIGRIEMPAWVADDPDLLDRVHAVVLSECRKGAGYPMILGEAHEQAVVRAAEREAFFQMLDRTLMRAGLPATGSQKRRAKQMARL